MNQRAPWIWCFCLVTLPIPNSWRIKTSLEQAACSNADYDMRWKIEKVVFRFSNRDQGWEENFGLKGMFLAIWWYWRILIKAKLLTLASIRTTAFHTLSLYFMQLSRGWFPPKTRCSWKLPTKSIKSYHLMSCFGKIDGIWIVLECPWPKTCIVPTPDSRIRSGNLVYW